MNQQLKRWVWDGLLSSTEGEVEFHTFKKHTKDRFLKVIEDLGGDIVSEKSAPLLILYPSRHEYRDGYVVEAYIRR